MPKRLDLIDQFTELVVGADDPRRLAERTLEVVMSLLNGRSSAVFTSAGDNVTLFASRGIDQAVLEIVPLGAVPRRTLRALFVARLGRWRALCGGSGLSARDRSGETRDLSAHFLRRAGHADEIDAAEAVVHCFVLRARH